jgi:hypothetical protein
MHGDEQYKVLQSFCVGMKRGLLFSGRKNEKVFENKLLKNGILRCIIVRLLCLGMGRHV